MGLQNYSGWILSGKAVLNVETQAANLDFCDDPKLSGLDIIVKVRVRGSVYGHGQVIS